MEDKMERCTLCPRACGVNRRQGQRGVCGETAQIRAARAALHMWEEPCISGRNGSGTVFFSGCGLGCVFCQNVQIASGAAGKPVTEERLAEIFLELQEKGANNINLVTACHFAPQVRNALARAKETGLLLPVVYNTSGYESPETLRLLEGYVDIYLPDLKYKSRERSRRYAGAPDYFERACTAIGEMVRQCGEMCFTDEATRTQRLSVDAYQERSARGESLLMTRGVIVRHLLLPGGEDDAREILEYLLAAYGERIFISIMNQYTPLPHIRAYPELRQTVRPQVYEDLLSYAIGLGLENGFFQEGSTAQESFIPAFDGCGIDRADNLEEECGER